ncbi:GNAT family N-acetyltransferase [Azospirillum soli]|uniref:GNAT family N-acetyltransferase n=1 Tax=Azospirillum soli TaxID=1304799 RepID=UPI001AE81EB5|nr:GNAT family protein [Azospirillum soli]MBP2316229.1 RimJ/RimL family protein N-acetyltransferase [Azospirillum soli]
MPFRFRSPTVDDAEMLLAWRTEPAITRFMFTDIDNPDASRQRAWIQAMEKRQDFRHFVIETQGCPIGYLSYSDINWVHRRCSSGSYIVDADARRTVAGFLHSFIMDYCFYALGMNKMVNYFMEGNDNVIKIQRILKCREVGVLKEHVFKYGRYHDVFVFEILKSEWEAQAHPFARERTLAAFDAVEG